MQTSLNNYEYLDILDHAWSASGAPGRPTPARDGLLCDVGCASFWYAAALEAFFRPRAMVGVDVEGYRLFKDGRTRSDYAAGYVGQRPNARFVVADYLGYAEPADVITAWFPFLTPRAILAWRLPLSLLRPERLFRQIHHNLRPGGMLRDGQPWSGRGGAGSSIVRRGRISARLSGIDTIAAEPRAPLPAGGVRLAPLGGTAARAGGNSGAVIPCPR